MRSRLSVPALVIVLVILAVVPSAAAPAIRPCAAGASYDPACDVDHDGDVDIFDIQKAAGHWNQSGAWSSDNDHDHLGQVWAGANNPLVINGSFGLPTLAPLALSNSLGYGLSIPTAGQSGVAIGSVGTDGVFVNSAGSPSTVNANPGDNGFEVAGAQGHGVYVGRADDSGVFVNSAGGKGVAVGTAGSPSTIGISTWNNGFEVLGAEDYGLWVGRADATGVFVGSAGSDGLFIDHASANGVRVDSAGGDGLSVGDAFDDGVRVGSANNRGMSISTVGNDGVYVAQAGAPSNYFSNADSNGFEVAGAEGYGLYVGRADAGGVRVEETNETGVHVIWASYGIETTGYNMAAFFNGDIHYSGSCVFCRLAAFAVNAGDRTLAQGDVVALAGLQETDMDTGSLLLEVVPADARLPLMGVVVGRAELTMSNDPQPGETGKRLVPRDGASAPGDYVTVVYSGPMQVRVDASEGAVAAGARLMASERPGHARAGRTVTIDGVELGENGSALGVALEPLATGEGLIWVLVNVQ